MLDRFETSACWTRVIVDEMFIEVLTGDKNDFFTKNRVKTALWVGLAIYFFVNENGAQSGWTLQYITIKTVIPSVLETMYAHIR